MNYGIYFGALFCLWPLLAFAGTQGFSSLLTLMTLGAVFYVRRAARPVLLACVAGLVVWIAVTELWSPVSQGFASGSLADRNFSIEAASVRIILTALAGAVTLAALEGFRAKAEGPPAPRWTRSLILGALGLQFAAIMIVVFFREPVFDFFDPVSDKTHEALQNVIRNMNAFALALPILAGWLALRPGAAYAGRAAAVIITALSLYGFYSFQADSALIMPFAALGALLIVMLFPVSGFKVLFGGMAGVILAIPAFIWALTTGLAQTGAVLPGSFQSRIWSWEAVLRKIEEAPLIGHGLGASASWREVYADHPEKLALMEPHWAQYPLIPSHPHNMALHVWSETGLIGAALLAAAVALIGFALPSPRSLTSMQRFMTAGLAGSAFVLFSFAYSAWNEAFWAGLVILAGVIILLARTEARAAV